MTAEISIKNSFVSFETDQGFEFRGVLLRLSRFDVAFELYNPQAVLRLSEVITGVRILINDQIAYSGTALLTNIVNASSMLICEAKLEEKGFTIMPPVSNGVPGFPFSEFMHQWQRMYKVRPEFKVAVADMQTFLTDLRLWLEQVELQVRSAPSGDRAQFEQQTVQKIGEEMVPAFDSMHERLETLSASIEKELRPVHQNFSKRMLHPLMLCSPFAYRTFSKPLGYAGDYEMVNMIARDPHEGPSVFAKVVNRWFLSQWPAKAHRNRISYLKSRMVEEALRVARLNRPLRVLNLGCGPAREVQDFLAESVLSDRAQFTLFDFNEETIQHTNQTLHDCTVRYGRHSEIQLQRKSVQQLLKEGARPGVNGTHPGYDMVYCAGLFDYLSDRVCKQLVELLYTRVAPNGLLVVTNVDDTKPFRHMLEFVLDWHLIYRDEKKAASLVPERAGLDNAKTVRDPTSVNVFIEVRKGEHA